ncbi:MAG TPA: FbpB family small basic protein [Bacillus sp. (in: firmicutes)]|uniref:FbpB family small basic protein n=1 Tax=Bacillus litorisediminis TaxID=2922713 RepID=UPI001FAC0864|nr:FbpB family small basic protein [Bacillus litorisediminis]HWO78726.1 FbpB family small basic protein [Bacillus sp. (in: firmicutes)]
MRKPKVDFLELVRKNKEDLLRDKEQIEKIEERIEERQVHSEKRKYENFGAGGAI